jgi:1-acyl-sn-glycerol-3-phosphate acyltransferase
MPAMPYRLRSHHLPLLRRENQRADDAEWIGALPPGRSVLRALRVLRRLLLMLLCTLAAVPVQALLLLLPGAAKARFPRWYWWSICRSVGLEVRVIGESAAGGVGSRPIVYVANHSSWLDIPALGSTLKTCFVAKHEVSGWPLIASVARLGRTVFVHRRFDTMLAERDMMRARLARGDSLLLFPEGTTSDGSRVMPFRSSFLSIAELPVTGDGLPPLVQPISVVYDRLAGLPTGRANRPLFAWYGDMDMATHFWRLAQHCGLRVTVLLHAPLEPLAWPDRKALAAVAWQTVASGSATLRQNRPALPLASPEARRMKVA